MKIEIKAPSPGESITEVELAQWLVSDGSMVEKDQELAELESDKATLPIMAEEAGLLNILIQEGEIIEVGTVLCTIDTEAVTSKEEPQAPKKKEVVKQMTTEPQEVIPPKKTEPAVSQTTQKSPDTSEVKISPLARELMDEKGLTVDDIMEGLRRISRLDVEAVAQLPKETPPPSTKSTSTLGEERIKMSNLRRRLSERLVAVKNETAMLTTFNEVDMTAVMALRKKNQEAFKEEYGIKLGFMSFFTKAVTEALKHHPMVNSRIERDEIVTPNYANISIAVSTPKGLMVPVVRETNNLSIPEIEMEIYRLAEKARNGRLSIDDMQGGTFTITNGGVFGSMLSTPIINPPQSGILGMHNIMQRPVIIDDEIVIRPMMYLALSYDHRVIDGKDSVGFLIKVKQYLENPDFWLLGL